MRKFDLIRFLYSAILIVAAVMVIINAVRPHSMDGFDDHDFAVVNAVFAYPGKSAEAVKFPYYVSAQNPGKVTLTYRLPAFSDHDDFLYLYSGHMNVEVEIDGRVVENYQAAGVKIRGNNAPARWLDVALEDDDAGKLLQISYDTKGENDGWIEKMYIGDQTAILYHLLRVNAFPMVTAFILIIMGIFVRVYDLGVLRKTKIRQYRFFGSFMIIIGLQLLMHSPIRQIYLQNIAYANVMENGFFVLSLAAFFMYLLGSGKNAERKTTWIGVICFFSGLCFHLIFKLVFHDNRFYLVYVAGALIMCLLWMSQFISHMSSIRRERRFAVLKNDEKTAFLADMSHAIRTPVNTVMGMDAMIMRESRNEKTLEYAADIKNAVASLLSIIDDILDFSKIESGKMQILPAEYDLSSLINDCYNMIIMRANTKGLELIVENDRQIPTKLYGDEMRLRQIMINILTNAVKYTRQGRVEFRIGYEQLAPDMINLKVEVRDTGIGIRPENMDRLFTSYERLDENRNRGIEGTGLGLSITRQLIFLMNGKISVESEYGKGSVFFVSIPQKVLDPEPIGNYSDRIREVRDNHVQNPEWFYAPKAQVLVVDDVDMNLKVMKALLQEAHMQVDLADGGNACLQSVVRKHYDIIFLDHMMPAPDGVETFRRMRSMHPVLNLDTPVIMLTANAVLGAKDKYLAEGFSDYLSKPVEESQLIEICKKHMKPGLFEEAPAGDEKEEKKETQKEDDQENAAVAALKEVLNVDEGMKFCMNRAAFYMEMVHDFLETGRIGMIRDSYQAGDMDSYRINVHSLKSMAHTLGADDVSEQAKALENAARNGDRAYVDAHHQQLLDAYELLTDRIRTALGSQREKEEVKRDASVAELAQLLHKAHDCARIFDADGACDAITQLNGCNLPEPLADRMKQLSQAGNEFELDEIQQIASEMLKVLDVNTPTESLY